MMKGEVIDWTEPSSILNIKRAEIRARDIEKTRHLVPFTLRWTVILGLPAFALAWLLGDDPRTLALIASGMLCIAIILPVGLSAMARMPRGSLARWRVDDRGVACNDELGLPLKWSEIRSFSVGKPPDLEDVGIVEFERIHLFREITRHKMYFDLREVDSKSLIARFTSNSKPAER